MALPACSPAATWRSVRLLDCQLAGPDRVAEVAGEAVAAFARDHVQPHAARRRVGVDAGGLVAHLLAHRLVDVGLHGAVELQAVDRHAVDHDGVVRRRHAVRGHVGLLHRARAADVGQAQVDAGDELADRLNHAAARQVVDRVAIEDLGVHGRRRVDDRRLAGDRDRLGQLADAQVGVDGRRELGREDDALAPDGLEARQREGDDVGARAADRRCGRRRCRR